ncbi:MAG: hypothetical protein HDR37_09850 [Treponema sp.]|nr:hypothetical protein [Treponema sp.]
MKKLTYAIIAFLTIVCTSLCAQTAGKKPTVVIVPFEAKSSGIGQDDCDIVTESFESEYARTGSALVVNRSTLKKIQTEQTFQNSDWSNNDKTAKLGEALNAQQLLFGSLRMYNGALFVTVQIQDITTLAVLASVSVRVKDTMELLDKIPEIGKNLAAEADSFVSQASRKKSSIVIMPFESKSDGIGQEDCDIISEMMESKYVQTGVVTVLNRGTLKKIQAEQAFQNSDWSDSNKTAKLGEALNAQHIVNGKLRSYNGVLFVTVQVQDIRTLAVLASVNMRVSNVEELLNRTSDICENLCVQTYSEWKIGAKGPGGGYVFYYSLKGFPVYKSDSAPPVICHYLECSPVELGNMSWCPCPYSNRHAFHYCSVTTNTGIGTGKKNTLNIIAKSHIGGSISISNCAAKACANYSTEKTKAGEWYLPSKDELNLIYVNLIKTGIIKSDKWYWSSSQHDKSSIYFFGMHGALKQLFSNGYQDYHTKDTNYCVRAVRAF